MISKESDLISWMYSEDETNSFFDDMLLVGMDIRIQTTRSSASPDAKRATFPMQATLYAAFMPVEAMTIEGSFNVAALRQTPSGERIKFPGQRIGLFSMILDPDNDLPFVRLGLFRPSLGIRYDDHTTYPYSYVTPTTRLNYTGPDWGEWGSELTWETKWWISGSLGIFGSEGLSQIQLSDGRNTMSAITGDMPTITARAVVWPGMFEESLEMYLGGSVLVNNDFSIVSAFVGAGWLDNMYLMLDYTQTTKENVQTSRNFFTELGWHVYPPLILYARYETGTTDTEFVTEQASLSHGVLGAQVFVMPYVEIRPEYRIYDSALPGVTTRWNVQLHIFY